MNDIATTAAADEAAALAHLSPPARDLRQRIDQALEGFKAEIDSLPMIKDEMGRETMELNLVFATATPAQGGFVMSVGVIARSDAAMHCIDALLDRLDERQAKRICARWLCSR